MAATNGQFWTQVFLKADGTPYTGVRCDHWVAGGTTTNLDVYQDANLSAPHNNPVVGDNTGRISFYGNGTYRLRIRTSAADGNVTLYDWDHVEILHHTATMRAEDRALSLPAAASASRGRLFGVVDGGGDVTGLWVQRSAAAWMQLLTLPNLSQMIAFNKGTDIASTTSVTIPGDGNFFDITGTNNIESFSGFTGYPVIYTRFTGSGLTLVNNSVTFILPEGSDYLTVQNEVITWMQLSTGVWLFMSSNRSAFLNQVITNYGLIATRPNRFTAKNIMPIGTLAGWSTVTAPNHWLLCNGGAINRTTYADLFAVIGTTYGAGNGSTTFNVPDLRGRVLMGLDGSANRITSASTGGANADTLGGTGGAQTHTLTDSEVPNLNIRVILDGAVGTAGIQGSSSINTSSVADATSGGDGPHSNTQPWIAMNYIIYAGV